MPLVFIVVLGIFLLAIAMSFTFKLLGLLLLLLMAGLIGALADAVVPGRLPGGWLGATLAGLAGSWLGVLMLGRLGPSLFGIRVIPAFLGAIAIAFLVELLAGRRAARVSGD